MIIKKIKILLFIKVYLIATGLFAQPNNTSVREKISIDKNWKFAFGHPSDTKKDFNTATAYFSYLSKAAFGDGAAKPNFDDRSWRNLDLPHDWAVEQPFDKNGSFSHGFKAIGRNFS